MRWTRLVVGAVSAGMFVSSASVLHAGVDNTPWFHWLDVPPDNSSTNVRAISGDGRVIVGNASGGAGPSRSVLWTVGGGFQDVTAPTGFFDMKALNFDGSAVVGANAPNAIRWTLATGAVILQPITPGASSAAFATGPGHTAVGVSGNQSVVWNHAGVPTALPQPPGVVFSAAHGVSSDGQTIVGESYGAGRYKPVMWQGGGAPIELPLPSGQSQASAELVSADGRVVAGWTFDGTARAVRWKDGLVTDLGGTIDSYPTGVSSDGGIIVGRDRTSSGRRGFVWTEATGMLDAGEFLNSFGIGPAPHVISNVYGISADGLTLTGVGSVQTPNGVRDRAWVARIPSPGCCSVLCLGMAVWKRRRTRPGTR